MASVLAAGGASYALIVPGDRSAASAGHDRLPPATDTINRTTLTDATTVDGRLDHAGRTPVKSAVEGTITKAAEPGKTVRQGQALYGLNAEPVILLYGSVPMFREMKPGINGPDVAQLERNLRDLGYGPDLAIGPKYDAHTKAAVKRWQQALGIQEPSGELAMGDVVFKPEAVRVVAADAALADRVSPDKTVLTVASTDPVVRVALDPDDEGLGKKGARVDVALPGGKSVKGRVSGPVQVPDGAEDPQAGTASGQEIEIALDGAVAGDATGTVSVTFTKERRENVLTVPVDAVVALREGGYGLEIVSGTTVSTVRVRTGMSADGRIEVTGTGLKEGQKVGVAAP